MSREFLVSEVTYLRNLVNNSVQKDQVIQVMRDYDLIKVCLFNKIIVDKINKQNKLIKWL